MLISVPAPHHLSDAELRRDYDAAMALAAVEVDAHTLKTPVFANEVRRLFELEAEMKKRSLLRWTP